MVLPWRRRRPTQRSGAELLVQYNTVKPKLKGPAVLLRFKDNFGLKNVWLKRKTRDRPIYFGLREQDGVTVSQLPHVIQSKGGTCI